MVNIPNRPAASIALNQSGGNVESDLQACIKAQAIVFEDAVKIIEKLEKAALRRELGDPDSIAQLQKSLDMVVTAQQKVAAAHSRYTQARSTLTVEMRATLGQHENLLKVLITRIDQLQTIFESARAELMPQLDIESRRRHMQAAYQKSLKTI